MENVSIIGCPSEACVNRLGQKLLEDRFLHGREPKAPGKMDFNRVQIFSGSLADLDQLEQKPSTSKNIWILRIKNAFATTLLLAATAFFSSFPFEHQIEDSILRIGIRLPGQAVEICRERLPEELAALPLHMRNAQDCKRTPIDYHLTITVDGQPLLNKVISATGARGDKPLVAEQDLAVQPGTHQISVQFKPLQSGASDGLALEENFSADFEKGRAILIVYNPNTKTLFHSKTAVK